MAELSSVGTNNRSRVENKGLNKHRQETNKDDVSAVEELNATCSQLARIEGLAAYKRVRKINASHNQLCRLTCFMPVKGYLERLELDDNKIHFLDGLNALTKLQWLSVAQNRIERVPVLDQLKVLRYLNLSNNSLQSLPNVASLQNLHTLMLSNNQLETLDLTRKYLPPSVAVLLLDGNKIRDLCQVSFLSVLEQLEHLSLAGNPCVSAMNTPFDFRPYLICCCQRLKVIDGFVVSESEQLKGEWLFSQGKGRQFLAGSHVALGSYLSRVCPLSDTAGNRLSTEFEERIQRVLEKKREHSSEASEYSSVVNSNCQSQFSPERKENGTAPERTDLSGSWTSLEKQHSPVVHGSETIASDEDRSEDSNPYDVYDSKVPFVASKSPFLFQNSNTNDRSLHPSTSREQFANKAACSPVRNSLLKSSDKIERTNESPQSWKFLGSKSKSVQNFVLSSSKRKLSFDDHFSEKELVAAVRLQSWWRGMKTRKTLELQKWFEQIRSRRYEQWIRHCVETSEKFSHELSNVKEVNSVLSNLNERLFAEMKRIKQEQVQDRVGFEDELRNLRNRCERLESFASFCLPVPTQLEFEIKNKNSGVLSWKLGDQIKISGYHLFVDGEHCGCVSARSCKACISDLDPTIFHNVCVKSFSECGLCSRSSETLRIGKLNRNSEEWPYFKSSLVEFHELKMVEQAREEILWCYYSSKSRRKAPVMKSSSSSRSDENLRKVVTVASRLKAQLPAEV